MAERHKLRCSKLPRLMMCAGGYLPNWQEGVGKDAVVIDNPYSAPSALGSAVHKGIEQLIKTGEKPDAAALAEDYALENQDDLRRLLWYGKVAWDNFKGKLVDPHAESGIKRALLLGDGRVVEITGHPDVIDSQPDGTLIVIDWKSGWVQYDAAAQLRAYGWCYLEKLPYVKKVVGVVVWLRHRTFQSWEWSRSGLEQWTERTVKSIVNWDKVFHSNPLCCYCPRNRQCPAQTALIKSAVGSLVHPGGVHDLVAGLTPHDLGALFEKVGQVEKLCKEAKDAVKARLLAGGPIAIDDSRELAIVESEREKIDTVAAWDVLTTMFSAEEMARFMRVSKTEMQNIVKDKAPRGQKGKMAAAIMDRLREEQATVVAKVETPTIRTRGDA